MIKKLFISMFLTLLISGVAYADVKYTKKTSINMNMPIPQDVNLPPEAQAMMQQAMQRSSMGSNTITTFIKGPKERIDYSQANTSTINRCDKKQIIELDHNKKTYRIQDMDAEAKEMQAMCTSQPQILDNPKNQKAPKGQLLMKTTIKDTGHTETINGYKARKYTRVTDISGNPSCMPDMFHNEELWVADIPEIKQFSCPAMDQIRACYTPANAPDCFQFAKVIRDGLTEVPPFVIKSVLKMDLPTEAFASIDDLSEEGITDDAVEDMPEHYTQTLLGHTMPSQTQQSVTTELISISYDPLTDDLFEIPADYQQDTAQLEIERFKQHR